MPNGEKTKELWKNSDYRKHMSEVHKGKIPGNKGKRYKIGKVFSKQGKHYSPKTEFKKGQHYSIQTEFKKGHKLQIGEKNNNWQGGISFEPYTIDWEETLRESIRQRDNYICQLCGTHQEELEEFIKKLDCHHIDYNKKNCSLNNLITLCRSCHMKTNTNRNYWINYFNSLLLI